MLIAVLDVLAASYNNSNLEITFYSHKCGGKGKNKFITAAYLHAVTNFLIHSVTQKYLVVGHTENEGDCSLYLIEKNIKRSLKSDPALFAHRMLQL